MKVLKKAFKLFFSHRPELGGEGLNNWRMFATPEVDNKVLSLQA